MTLISNLGGSKGILIENISTFNFNLVATIKLTTRQQHARVKPARKCVGAITIAGTKLVPAPVRNVNELTELMDSFRRVLHT